MTDQSVLPASIEIWEIERRLLNPDLDLDYIHELAADVAAILYSGCVTEFVYQPNDGTRYPLVIVPLVSMLHAKTTLKPGWELHAVSGMANRGRNDAQVIAAEFYEPNGYLINWIENASYPLRLSNRGHDIAAVYVAEHWNTTGGSGCSLAVLFRAVSYHLDQLVER